ncbi:nitrous oxide reductase accessory protein NosL [Flagellimonas sp. S174]|uniref:nitrous oxide reductase accessory protein NosL n=1 Tax=Flagellimonas sp. S174 TaxID=3410790 RepID=UPI003BF5CC83
MKKSSAYLLLILILSCKVAPEPIVYGETSCNFCSMTVVDKQHAAQLVTAKGKVFNFDALECMINYLSEVEVQEIGLLLTNTYHQPEVLTEVQNCTFLISEGIPSPMGAYLTAFQTVGEAQTALAEHHGELFTWEELRVRFEKNPDISHNHVYHKH